jgi:catechol 2,3-dioxygenase-like lactoylglutathione lyase family enzyme
MKITTVLMVESIERSLPFWVDRVGFTKTVEVPEGNVLGFVILVRDGAELMLQTFESVRKDAPQFIPEHRASNTGLFIEVDDFADVLKRLQGYPIALAERVTNYGMREIGVRDPDGHIVLFAARA